MCVPQGWVAAKCPAGTPKSPSKSDFIQKLAPDKGGWGSCPSVTFYLRPPSSGQPPPDSLADKEQQSQGSSVSPGPTREGGSGLCCPTGARSPPSAVAGSGRGWGWVGRALGLESESPVCQSDATPVSSEEGTWGEPAAFPEGWLGGLTVVRE